MHRRTDSSRVSMIWVARNVSRLIRTVENPAANAPYSDVNIIAAIVSATAFSTSVKAADKRRRVGKVGVGKIFIALVRIELLATSLRAFQPFPAACSAQSFFYLVDESVTLFGYVHNRGKAWTCRREVA